jgi:c-di-GMP-binding flagellar brake protein YcgR
MSTSEKNFQKKSAAGWELKDAGYELTTSITIIQSLLGTLKKERNFITLSHKGYQSFGTILENVTSTECVVDKPKDWAGTPAKIRISFKNSSKVSHHFYSQVTSATRNNLHLTLPKKMYRLQRRSHYRVDLPEGSIATFMYNGKKCKFNIKDVSLSGMLIYSKIDEKISKHIKQIDSIAVLPSLAEGNDFSLKIKKGEFVRTTYNKRHNIFFYGVHYMPTSREEEAIMKFIRKRELQILRKGVKKK